MGERPLAGSALRQVAQPSRDLVRSVAFYRDVLGATHIATFNPPGLAFFEIGGVRLMLNAIPGAIGREGSPLYFAVDDIDAAAAALLAAGVEIEQEPAPVHRDEAGDFGPAGSEEWMSFFRDPDGNVLAFSEIRTPQGQKDSS